MPQAKRFIQKQMFDVKPQEKAALQQNAAPFDMKNKQSPPKPPIKKPPRAYRQYAPPHFIPEKRPPLANELVNKLTRKVHYLEKEIASLKYQLESKNKIRIPAKKIARPRTSAPPTATGARSRFRFAFSPAFGMFIGILLIIGLTVPAVTKLAQGLTAKEVVLNNTSSAYQNLLEAQKALLSLNTLAAKQNFESAYAYFLKVATEIKSVGGGLLYVLEKLPGGKTIADGHNLLKAGEAIAKAGSHLTDGLSLFTGLTSEALVQNGESSNSIPVTTRLSSFGSYLELTLSELKKAQKAIIAVRAEDLPAAYRQQIVQMQTNLPQAIELIANAEQSLSIITKILGQENPRQYLVLFQNNAEIRATGGFIGSYALLKFNQGRMEKIFVDDIYNADGQLAINIIPPKPIQRIASGWSTHDANWFFDFPTSAKKIAWFYEKTGGPTVDGVIAITPRVIEDILEILGPVELPQYNITLNNLNFRNTLQFEIEENYDKEVNQPKTILKELAPLLLERLLTAKAQDWAKLLIAFNQALTEKDILLFSSDPEEEQFFVEHGWAGEILDIGKDYLAVVHSNLNGFKTDLVIDERVEHKVKIEPDGRIISEVAITRTHKGGGQTSEFYNKVNTDYMRVYVPKGSKLIKAEGHTVDKVEPALDYTKNAFEIDPLVNEIESTLRIDPSGTQVFEESGKTVFGNWVFVSPGESVTVRYQYELPFRLDLNKPKTAYTLVTQKQPGRVSFYDFSLVPPSDKTVFWSYPQQLIKQEAGTVSYANQLKQDMIFGLVFK